MNLAQISISLHFYHLILLITIKKISDLIVGVNLGTVTDKTPNYQYQNIAKADNKGWEISSKLFLNPFSLDLSYTSVTSLYSDGIYNKYNPYYSPGKRIPDIPSGSFFARLNYSIPVFLPWSQQGGNISLEYRWNGDVFAWDGYGYNKASNNYVSGAYPDYYSYYTTFAWLFKN